MNKLSLDALGRELLERARSGPAGRAAETIYGGHERRLRQTLVALKRGAQLGEHESPGEATVQVISGRIRLTAGETSWDGRDGDLIAVPAERHDVAAVDDAIILLTVALAS